MEKQLESFKHRMLEVIHERRLRILKSKSTASPAGAPRAHTPARPQTAEAQAGNGEKRSPAAATPAAATPDKTVESKPHVLVKQLPNKETLQRSKTGLSAGASAEPSFEADLVYKAPSGSVIAAKNLDVIAGNSSPRNRHLLGSQSTGSSPLSTSFHGAL